MSLLQLLKTALITVNPGYDNRRKEQEEAAENAAILKAVDAAWQALSPMFQRDLKTLDSLNVDAIIQECADPTNLEALDAFNRMHNYGGRPTWLGKAITEIHTLDTEKGTTSIPTQKASFAYAQRVLAQLEPIKAAYAAQLPEYLNRVVQRLEAKKAEVAADTETKPVRKNQLEIDFNRTIEFVNRTYEKNRTAEALAGKLGYVARTFSPHTFKELGLDDLKQEVLQIHTAYSQMLRYTDTLKKIKPLGDNLSQV